MFLGGIILPINLKVYSREGVEDYENYQLANEYANVLVEYLNQPNIQEQLTEANVPGASSAKIQEIILEKAEELGFKDEKKGLFSTYATKSLRPDYYKKLKDDGILIEVERGKILDNNMDMLDIWKCHICRHANYLFLFVPNLLRHNNLESGRRVFNAVCDRLGTFFEKDNYIDIYALFIFGY